MNPLRALTPRQRRQEVNRYVRANTRPFERQIERRTRGASQNISGIANELARSLGGQVAAQGDIYGKADASLAGIDTAIADRLGGTGREDAEALKKRLELSGQSPAMIAQLGGGATTAAAGTAGAGFARGSAERSALAQKRAGAESYASNLPGLARLSSIQGVRDVEARGQRDLADLHSRTPSMIVAAMRDVENRELNKAVAGLGYQSDVYGQQQQNYRTGLQQGGANARTGASQRGQNARTAAGLRVFDPVYSAQTGFRMRKDGTFIRGRKGKKLRYHPGRAPGAKNTGGGNPIIP